MKTRYFFTKTIVIILTLLLSAGLASCGGQTTKVRVGTSGIYSPFTFYEGENLTGYDIEVLRLLESRMDGVEFEFVATMTFEGLIAGLDAGNYEMVAQQIAQNAERREKYLFPEYGYTLAETYLVVHENETRTQLSQFAGDTLGGLSNDFFRRVLDSHNEDLGNIFTVNTYEDYTPLFLDIHMGRVAGTLNDNIVIAYQAQHLGMDLKFVGEPLEEDFSYFLLPQTDAGRDLRDKLDKALEETLADGAMAALSVEWFGADYTGGGK